MISAVVVKQGWRHKADTSLDRRGTRPTATTPANFILQGRAAETCSGKRRAEAASTKMIAFRLRGWRCVTHDGLRSRLQQHQVHSPLLQPNAETRLRYGSLYANIRPSSFYFSEMLETYALYPLQVASVPATKRREAGSHFPLTTPLVTSSVLPRTTGLRVFILNFFFRI
jgi:hypothetical protein